jgi:glycine/D-amino acid oxidase-like deaminating enzyme/nitrite reductase/ring-hydroxylating ferredoxin subunit
LQAAIHQSYWVNRWPLQKKYSELDTDHETEVLVVGGGISGLSIALELLARGKRVTVCEANTIGAGTTGGSSAHLDAHPELGPSRLLDKFGVEKAGVYTRMRLDAIDTIRSRCDETCEFSQVPGFSYTENADDIESLRAEFESAAKIGLTVTWHDHVGLPKAAGGYSVAGMARFDPIAYLNRLASLVEENGGTIFEHTLVSGAIEPHPNSLKTSGGKVSFEHVVLAVHCNYTDSMRLYLQTPAYQSYIIAANVASPIPDALFWDNSNPYFYVRRGTVDGSTMLAGGCDHRTGAGDETASLDKLERWLRDRFAVKKIVSHWSAELFEPTDGLPFIGKVAGKENVWIATGLSGVGLTVGTAAGGMIADLLDGVFHPLEDDFSPARVPLRSSGKVIAEQTTAVLNLAQRLAPASEVDPEKLNPGEGIVGDVDGKHTAVCRDTGGCVHRLSPICSHMGGVVRWNEVEQTWDCPVHGGRFAADGKRLYGPPENDLTR